MNKYQEALDELFDNATNGEPLYVKQKYFNGIQECKNELQELVDKATPKKPMYAKRYPSSSCPNCFSNLGDNKYCRDCGQAIDWSEDE